MRRPAAVHPWADDILTRLASHEASGEIVLGGYFALQQYLPYRETADIDAWWRTRSQPATVAAIRSALQSFAADHGCELFERSFGETESFELLLDGRKAYSFQIAVRTVELDQPETSLWPPILIETLRDNIDSKMNALVDRGAPRDFLDVEQAVRAGLLTVQDCWNFWSLKNPHAAPGTGRQKALLHLAALELRRPLASINDPEERLAAERRRLWFRQEFLTESP